MTDVRTLLQREREARRIQHPYLTYAKSGALTCTVCNLNIKSEALWEGHLKSANHRKNLREAVKSTAGAGNGKKRKIAEVTEEDNPRKRKTEEFDEDTRKKREVSFTASVPQEIPSILATEDQAEVVLPAAVPQTTLSPPPVAAPDPQPVTASVSAVDEDEWAAFEAEVAPLAREQPQDYSGATISAAPVSASELAAQQAASERRLRRDLEAEDEKEEEEQRIAEEFDVMEEMEERVRRLKEKREALRIARPNSIYSPAAEPIPTKDEPKPPAESLESESSDEDVDDWYS